MAEVQLDCNSGVWIQKTESTSGSSFKSLEKCLVLTLDKKKKKNQKRNDYKSLVMDKKYTEQAS
jgi:hypothetical protein